MLKSTTGHLIENIRPETSIPEFNVPIQKGVQTLTQVKSGFNPVFEYQFQKWDVNLDQSITRETVFEPKEIEEYQTLKEVPIFYQTIFKEQSKPLQLVNLNKPV